MKVGDKIFISRKGWKESPYIRETVVTKVGRKYFQVAGTGSDTKFQIDTWAEVNDFNKIYNLWPTLELYQEVEERRYLLDKIRQKLGTFDQLKHISLEDIRKIYDLFQDTP